MAKATIDKLPIDLATKPLYAGVGATDLAVEALREYVADVQKKVAGYRSDVETRVAGVQKNVKGFDFEPKALRDQAVTVVNARVAELQSGAKAYPAKVQSLVEANVATATGTYDDLVKRGETLVKRIRNQETTQAAAANAATTTAKARTTTTQARKAATQATKSSTTTAKTTTSAAKKSSGTAARKTATTAKRSTAQAKKAPAKKAATTTSSAKATGTAARKTASSATKATQAAAKKVGD